MLSFSAHKLQGPQGIGVLVLRKDGYRLPPIKGIMYGGQQEHGIRPGTIPVALVAGCGYACEIASLDYERNKEKMDALKKLVLTIFDESGINYHFKKTKTFPIFINYDKQDNISDTTKYEDHFVAENRLIAISKSGRSMDLEDVQNFLNATERGVDVQLFVRKNKDDKISKEFYYLGRVIATGNAKQFVMPNTDKTAVEIEWELETPVREDIYQYIVNE